MIIAALAITSFFSSFHASREMEREKRQKSTRKKERKGQHCSALLSLPPPRARLAFAWPGLPSLVELPDADDGDLGARHHRLPIA